MTESEAKSLRGYAATRKVVNISGGEGLILETAYENLGQRVTHSILCFSRGHELWEIHLLGVNDNDPDSIRDMRDKIYGSIKTNI